MGGSQSVLPRDVAPPKMEGGLHKQSDHLKDWRERYFRINPETRELGYWDFQPADDGFLEAPKAILTLANGVVEEKNTADGSRSSLDYPNQFIVRDTNKSEQFTLCAGSTHERRLWLERLFLVTLPVKSGTLLKQSDHVKQWRSRFIRVEFGKLLYWDDEHASRTLPVPKGYLELQGGSVQQLPPSDGARFSFAVEGAAVDGEASRHYILNASGIAEHRAWTTVLEAAVQRRGDRDVAQRMVEQSRAIREQSKEARDAAAARNEKAYQAVTTRAARRDAANKTTSDMAAKYRRV